ncbi:MAG: hypothetical protein IT365_12905 [Candidatus Hydrogenedentes bacterium]|nr:hypothetical protein [Candidatus Hydrogenedentota bacterium]
MMALRLRYSDTYDAVSMLVYLLAVYTWGLFAYPMGRDFDVLATGAADYPAIARSVFQAEVAVFGTWLPGYHLVNMLLLYACMLCIYHFTNMTLRGLWWFGTLAACMFMANPVHTEAILNICGVLDIIPCLLALLALTAYAWLAKDSKTWKLFVFLALLALATLTFPENAYLWLVLALYEVLAVPTGKHSMPRLGLSLLVGVVSVAANWATLSSGPYHLADMFVPLYFLFYPLGFLPESVANFRAHPWLGWLAAAAVAFILFLIYRKARRPVILFALLSMLVLRLAPAERPVDPVSLVGGGQLLLPNVLFVLGLVALFFRIMQHPKWRISMIGITTSIVIVLFAMQWSSVRRWHEAGRIVRAFQTQAQDLYAKTGATVGVLPDYQTYHGAPLRLSASVKHETPFSPQVPVLSILPLNGERPKHRTTTLEVWTPEGGLLTLTGKRPLSLDALFPVPGILAKQGDVAPAGNLMTEDDTPVAGLTVRVGHASPEIVQLELRSTGERLPVVIAPGGDPLPGKEAGEDAEARAEDG